MPGGLPAHDVYAYFYPNMLYGLRSLAVGGAGLLWNPFQNCGQPFFAITGVGAAYPPNLFFLVLPHEVALRALLFTNLLIGGIGTYALGRELQLSRFRGRRRGARLRARQCGLLPDHLGAGHPDAVHLDAGGDVVLRAADASDPPCGARSCSAWRSAPASWLATPSSCCSPARRSRCGWCGV